MRQALALFRRIQQEADPGSANRNWNDTTAMVIRGDALMQMHGDWMKGEFAGAKKAIGVDYDTMLPPGTNGIQVTIDAETFLKPKDQIKKNSIEAFFGIMLQKEITEQFSIIKGCTPIRLDATKGIDKHAKMVLEALGKKNYGHPVRNITMNNDFAGAYANLADKFWNTPAMTADQFIKELQEQYDVILGD
jgi:glucose/mannose transport system substrate-binding protein